MTAKTALKAVKSVKIFDFEVNFSIFQRAWFLPHHFFSIHRMNMSWRTLDSLEPRESLGSLQNIIWAFRNFSRSSWSQHVGRNSSKHCYSFELWRPFELFLVDTLTSTGPKNFLNAQMTLCKFSRLSLGSKESNARRFMFIWCVEKKWRGKN